MPVNATSPASSGPAGSLFEGQVGAHYLLSMLVGTEPRGLPGTTIDRIELQRAAEDRHLDDVIVHAYDTRGGPAVVEIQVKRSITFAPGDDVFRKVVGQIANASRRPDFWDTRYELAIAIAKTSQKIDKSYQEVLAWSRHLDDSATFHDRIIRHGSGNSGMRTFVQTFKSHLHEYGSPNDDETVWRLLRRLQILVFDFAAPGSASEELAKERAIRALHPDDSLKAGSLWDILVALALRVAASGGDQTKDVLIEHLRSRSFSLAGDRRYSSARAALAEDSRNALADIVDRIGGIRLTRHERTAAVFAALNTGRYVEIRGDAGVGKSAMLKYFAEQVDLEAQAVVLSPNRTTPRGWTALRNVIGFDGTARDLLIDLASDGGAILFIDNLDFFSNDERTTVVDLVRDAANIPGFSVIVTARRGFGVDEPSWLPPEALDRLGRTEPIVVGELNDDEIDELRQHAPGLAQLLADSHPARNVTRNLFRLSRLASQPADEPVPHTEVDMALQWWQTADGRRDSDYRERARLLKALAEQALVRATQLNISDYTVRPVEALLASETLRELSIDLVAFRHDVLREWAIANLLHFEPATIERLPLDRPASAALARGVELAARMALEREIDCTRWHSLIERLSYGTTHASWRRAVLLALVRSEIGAELLTRASIHLLADRATMLRELIRIVMAVDVEPASKWFVPAGVDPALIPASLNVPSGPSWRRLIIWLLGLEQDLPPAAIPQVVDLYTGWSSGFMGLDSLTPVLLQRLYRWLADIEAVLDPEHLADRRTLLGGELDSDQIVPLGFALRTGFLLFCHRTPAQAVEYLQLLSQLTPDAASVRNILNFRGSLAQAAPEELAELTAAILIPEQSSSAQCHSDRLEEPFNFVDFAFFPGSPMQGPFFEILSHAPAHGLSLIRRLVDHAVSFYNEGRERGTDALIISFPSGERIFPWVKTYAWPRDGAGQVVLASALMALEAWAHKRVDEGEDFDQVLAEILCPPEPPAAYVMLAVDLLLSHWPKSRDAAIPFLACPELLCIDRQRHAHDNTGYPDFFGLKALQQEPIGGASLEGLQKRASRSHRLDQLLPQYAVFGPNERRESLNDLLHSAAVRLGPPNEQSDFLDPAFMAVHALNLVDQNNWPEVEVQLTDGTLTRQREYVSPEAERRHLAAFKDATRERRDETSMRTAIGQALEDRSKSSPEFAAAAVEWSQRTTASHAHKSEDWVPEHEVIAAAMIAMRDGDTNLQGEHEAWARDVFSRALQTREEKVHRIRTGLQFNPIAIAFAGMIHLLQVHAGSNDVHALLEVAARDNPAAAHGLGKAANALAASDERLPRAMLRCAFAACIRPRHEWDLAENEAAERSERCQQRVRETVANELAWLTDHRHEPDWPAFPAEPVRRRRRFGIASERDLQDLTEPQRRQPDEYTDYQAAALWLANAECSFNIAAQPWLRSIVEAYAPWTADANGANLEEYEELDHSPREWNEAYFDLLANCLPTFTMEEVDQLALTPINSLPDQSFFDVVARFLRSVDTVYFNIRGLEERIATNIRSALANRMLASRGWQQLSGSRSTRIELHLGPAIAVLFCNDHHFIQPTKCYLFPQGADRIDTFLPVLETLVKSGPSFFVAMVTLNLLEVAPRPALLPFIVVAAMTWLERFPDATDFWLDHEIGHRVCVLIEKMLHAEPELLDLGGQERFSVDQLLATLIGLGVPDAAQLEASLNN